jgi:hypothetical protein
MRLACSFLAPLVVLIPALLGAQTPAPSSSIPAESYRALRWRTIGPEGNRFSAAAGIPGNHLTYYVGAASGGIW